MEYIYIGLGLAFLAYILDVLFSPFRKTSIQIRGYGVTVLDVQLGRCMYFVTLPLIILLIFILGVVVTAINLLQALRQIKDDNK